MRLTAIDAVAQRLGLAPGMTLADARARCPGLATAPADPQADARELARLTASMVRFTPMVAADPPDGLVLDITGCAHLFGGEEALVQGAAAFSGFTARTALAGNASAARALARHGGRGTSVRDLPVAALELDAEAEAALHRAGLHRLGDLARRPMPALAARFGAAAVLHLRQILGEVARPLTPHRAAPRLHFETRFADPVLHTEDALEAIENLLTEAVRAMEARDIGGRRFALRFHRSDNRMRELAVETGQPVRDPAVVMRLLRERIETLSDPLDPGFGFDAVELAIPRSDPLPARQIAQEGLDEANEDAHSAFASLVDRLCVRLGQDSVLRLTPLDRHLPERAQRFETALGTAPKPWPRDRDTRPRPLVLFDPPEPVTAIAGVPDGPPQRFRWQGRLHEVRLAEGPERIAAEWWRKRGGHLPGNMPRTRDYYRIEDSEGHRYWIFRSGLFDETASPDWYLHGLFA